MAPTTIDIAFDLLKNARRRRILSHLLMADGPVELKALAEKVAAAVSDQSAALPPEEFEATCTSLVHSHIPRLEDAGFIEYDTERSTVALTCQAGEIEPLLSVGMQIEQGQS